MITNAPRIAEEVSRMTRSTTQGGRGKNGPGEVHECLELDLGCDHGY